MHKLVILVDELEGQTNFDELWPGFLSLAEQMPGLRREVTSRVDRVVFGKSACSLIHELYFDSLEAVRQAMNSPQGLQAGQMLQKLTQGHMTLLIADHKEDELANILQYRSVQEKPDEKKPV
jgi:uncharacterized protein (TIGR02118 family)